MVVIYYIGVVLGVLNSAAADNSVCEGIWNLDRVDKCENPQQYPMDIEVKKRKVNRTHVGFSLKMDLREDITSDYMLILESYEKCDGGYKASGTLSGSACEMLNSYSKENFQKVLRLMGVDPQDCPIPKGEVEVIDYVINYESLPEQAKCGEYKWLGYLVKNNERISCITTYTTFTKKEEDYDDE